MTTADILSLHSMSVSILIPCFNAKAFVLDTVRSALAQTDPGVEVILVDDGSTDDTLDVLSSEQDERLTIICDKNQGAAAARNRAFAASKGEFVLYLDADDLISSNHVALLKRAAMAHPGTVALSEWDRFQASPNEAVFPRRETYVNATGPDYLVQQWTSGAPMTQCGSALIPRKLIEQHGGWDERLSLIDDFEFFARILARSAGVCFAPQARLYYRSGITGSLSGRKSRKAVESALLSISLGTGHLLAVENSVRSRRACANIFQSFEYEHYPLHADLRARARMRVGELGGAELEPVGPPNFHRLRKLVGWRCARRVQRAFGR